MSTYGWTLQFVGGGRQLDTGVRNHLLGYRLGLCWVITKSGTKRVGATLRRLSRTIKTARSWLLRLVLGSGALISILVVWLLLLVLRRTSLILLAILVVWGLLVTTIVVTSMHAGSSRHDDVSGQLKMVLSWL